MISANASSDSATARREELEKKRAKLQELRRAREEKLQQQQQQQQQSESLVTSTETKAFIPQIDVPENEASLEFKKAAEKTEECMGNVRRHQPQINLTMEDFVLMDLVPAPIHMYSKEAQTIPEEFMDSESGEGNVNSQMPTDAKASLSVTQHSLSIPEYRDAETEIVDSTWLMESITINNLSAEAKCQIITSESFLDFIHSSSLLVEKALSDPSNPLKKFSFEPKSSGTSSDRILTLYHSFMDDQHCRGRVVTDLCWSSTHKELILASYNHPGTERGSSASDGLILLWNRTFTSRPEIMLKSPTPIHCAKFVPQQANLVVGSGYSGQIFLWDLRQPRTPALQTSLSGMAHSHPVLSLSLIGPSASISLLSLSDDGRLCSWTLDQFAQPQETLDLTHPSGLNCEVEEISVSCAAFQPCETAAFWVGEESGMLCKVNRYETAGSKAGVVYQPIQDGHDTLITGLCFNPAERFKDLLLSCSADWTIKLWSAKHFGSHAMVSPLKNFENCEGYVFDVKWSPTHPAVFAAVDGAGNVLLYNLLIDEESPIACKLLDPNHSTALNKLTWSSKGDEIMVGSSDGHLHLFAISDRSLYVPTSDDIAAFAERYCV